MPDDNPLRSVESTFNDLRRELGLLPAEQEDEPEAPESIPEVPVADAPEDIHVPELTGGDEDTFPGSRRPRRAEPEEEDEDAPEWDTHPRTYVTSEGEQEFFPISALAIALNRKPGTLRVWETNGYLPSATFRTPGKKKSKQRLYTRAQIEGLRALAIEEGLMDPTKKLRIDQTRFPERAKRLFSALNQRRK